MCVCVRACVRACVCVRRSCMYKRGKGGGGVMRVFCCPLRASGKAGARVY